MPTYTVTDPRSNRTVKLTGDSPPTEAELHQIFAKVNAAVLANVRTARPEDFTDSTAPQGSASGRFLSNLGAQLNPITMAQGLYGAVRHPLDTATAAAGQMGDQWTQAKQQFGEGRYSEAIGHAAAGSIPVLGPAAAAIGEQGARGDIAGMFGAGAGLVAPFAAVPAVKAGLGNAAKATGAVGRTIAPRATAAAADALDASAASRYADVMSPKGGPNARRFGNLAKSVAPDLAKNPETSALSRTGLHQAVADGLEKASNTLDELADARGAGRVYDTKPILSDLYKARQALVAEAVKADEIAPKAGYARAGDGTLTETKTGIPMGADVTPSPSAPRVAAIDRVIGEVKQLGPKANFEALRRIRQSWDGVAKQKYVATVTDDFLRKQGEASGAADATGVLREHLAGFEPDTAAANAQYHTYRSANDVMKAAEEVDRAKPKVGRKIMARLTGVLAGGRAAGVPGELVGYALGPVVDSVVSSGVTPSIKIARTMSDLAQALRTGNVERAAHSVGRLKAYAKATGKSVVKTSALSGSPATAGADWRR